MQNFKELLETNEVNRCPKFYLLALTDTLNVINGKWKLPIIAALLRGVTRFKDLRERVSGITPRMLSKELKELELNGIVQRKVYDQMPVLVEYHLTTSGKDIVNLIDAMIDWGTLHRAHIFDEAAKKENV